MEIRKAVVTGASGMLGCALIRRLLQEDIQIYAVVRKGSKQNDLIPQDEKQVKVIECDLTKMRQLPGQIKENCDAFFHFAWGGTFGDNRNDVYGQLDNVKYCIDAVEAAKELGCKVFLGAGSQAEFGRTEEYVKLSSNLAANPETGYGIAKLCAGQMSRALCKKYGICHIWTRILSVYGPGDKDRTMIMSGICSMLRGENPKYTKGEQMWDYLYCDDAAEAFYLAASRGRDGSVYCVGSGQVRQLKEYIKDVRDVVNPQQEITFGEVPYYDHQVMYLCADIRELQEDTGFYPKTDFKKGIRETVEWRKKWME